MFYDVHAHILNMDYVPDKCIGIELPLSKILMNKAGKFLHWLWPFSDDDVFEDISAFNENMSMSQDENFSELASKYQFESCICIVQMDFFSVKGHLKVPYEMQLLEALEIRNKFGRDKAKVFMGLDPNAPYYDYLIEKYIDIVDGIKLYPPLNAIPTHRNFDRLWKICIKKSIPITAHCGPDAMVTAPFFNNKTAAEYANPKNWECVLTRYPELKLNLAHFGSGNQTWENWIISFMRRFPNVYTDTSYSITSNRRMERYKYWLETEEKFADRLLFGSDYFISKMSDRNLEKCIDRANKYLGNDAMKKATMHNPARFLFRGN